jgi:hypothetical protein
VGIKHSGDVRCNIVAARISLEDGAKFESSIDMDPKASKSGFNANARGANKPIQQATV